MKLIINTDGGSRGNPGPSGIGVVIKDEKGMIISEHKQYIGETTNNQAEYKALILGLEEAGKVTSDPSSRADESAHYGAGGLRVTGGAFLEFRMDSELIVRQMQGRYKIKDQGLKPLAEIVIKLCKNFEKVEFHHVPRAQNSDADRLVNEAIDSEMTKMNIN